MKEKKAMALRLDQEQAEELEVVARVDGLSISETVRNAISAHLEERRKDKSFQQRLRKNIAQNQEILNRLAQ